MGEFSLCFIDYYLFLLFLFFVVFVLPIVSHQNDVFHAQDELPTTTFKIKKSSWTESLLTNNDNNNDDNDYDVDDYL